jgi:hypothetical protein
MPVSRSSLSAVRRQTPAGRATAIGADGVLAEAVNLTVDVPGGLRSPRRAEILPAESVARRAWGVSFRIIVGLGLSALCVAACGGKSATTALRTMSQPQVKLSAATALRWPRSFCKLRPGTSKAQILRVMGPPTYRGFDSSGLPNVGWFALGYEFSADLDKAGTISTSLDVLPDLEAPQDPRMTNRLRNCPYLTPGG